MKILVTGFDPFDNAVINPAWEAVNALPAQIAGAEIKKVQVPTVFYESINVMVEAAQEFRPDFILCVGQAGGRSDVTVERVGINVDDARIKDNKGNRPIDTSIFDDGENAYFVKLPIKKMVQFVRFAGIPCSISNTAGTFVCNHLLYGLLYYISKHSIAKAGGFIHVPYLPEQVLDKPHQPSMSQENITCALVKMIEAIADGLDDIKISEGKIF